MTNESEQKSQIDGDLHINSVRRNDSGYYRCVWNHAGEHYDHNENLNIFKLETICK